MYCEIPIQFTDAVLGGELLVPTIDGKVSIKIPSETQTGATFRLRGKGVKSLRGSKTGDLICKVIVETPTKLTTDQKDMLKAFQESLDQNSKSHTQKKSSWQSKMKSFLEKLGLS